MTTETRTISSTQLRVLSSDQVRFYHDEGYLVLRNVFTKDQVALLGEEGDRIARDHEDLIDQKNMRVQFKPNFGFTTLTEHFGSFTLSMTMGWIILALARPSS